MKPELTPVWGLRGVGSRLSMEDGCGGGGDVRQQLVCVPNFWIFQCGAKIGGAPSKTKTLNESPHLNSSTWTSLPRLSTASNGLWRQLLDKK
jgi:hypothetical protein